VEASGGDPNARALATRPDPRVNDQVKRFAFRTTRLEQLDVSCTPTPALADYAVSNVYDGTKSSHHVERETGSLVEGLAGGEIEVADPEFVVTSGCSAVMLTTRGR
jgi:hypothetical protein